MTSSTTSVSARIAFANLLVAAVFGASSTACSIFAGEASPSQPADGAPMPSRQDPNLPAVGGVMDPSELTDELGVFVSPDGAPHTDGNHARPALTIQDGIDLAKRVGKRVYVCAGTFHEQITVVDSVSIIGGLDCRNNDWNVGAPGSRTRIEAPMSPAVRATNIESPTRLSGLDIVAPDAAKPSDSSIGLLANHAGALTIVSSKITAGNAAKGADGADAVQLANAPTVDGSAGWDQRNCTGGGGCILDPVQPGHWQYPPRGQQGQNVCIGASGFVGQSGGFGGSAGLYQIDLAGPTTVVDVYRGRTTYQCEDGEHARTSSAGADGADGANAPSSYSITADGFSPASGAAGKDGAPGFGGRGGDGFSSTTSDPLVGDVWTGWTGAGGGAGGCPGLAGRAGNGGGASIAAVLIDSAVTFDRAELVSSKGGEGGRGSFGSAPTAGGAAGINSTPALIPTRSAQPGGRGGVAGVSGNGASGPSLGIAVLGAKPVVGPTTTITVGIGGPGIPARSRTTLGVTKTLSATPAGLSKEIAEL